MTIPDGLRIACCLSLLTLPALWLGGCGQGDGGEYRAYDAELDERPITPPAAPATGATPPQTVSPAPTDQPTENLATGEPTLPGTPPVASSEPVDDNTTAAPPSDVAAVTPGESGTPAAAAPGSPGAAATPTVPREIKLLIPEKSFQKVGPENALRMTFDDIDLLKIVNMDPVRPDAEAHMPAWLTDLDGKRIRIRGYMRPGELSEDLPFFLLVRDTSCCFGPLPKPYDIIPVVMREGITTDYVYLRPIDVVGEFDIAVEMDLDDESRVQFLYILRDAVVIEK